MAESASRLGIRKRGLECHHGRENRFLAEHPLWLRPRQRAFLATSRTRGIHCVPGLRGRLRDALRSGWNDATLGSGAMDQMRHRALRWNDQLLDRGDTRQLGLVSDRPTLDFRSSDSAADGGKRRNYCAFPGSRWRMATDARGRLSDVCHRHDWSDGLLAGAGWV